MSYHGKIHKVMSEFKGRTLHSGSGEIVKGRKQAVAIALSEARQAGAKIPKRKKAYRLSEGGVAKG